MGNIIDIRDRLKSQNPSGMPMGQEGEASIVDIAPIREEKINADRRQVKRTILTEFISAHMVVPGHGLMKVNLYDINEGGIAFDLEEGVGRYNIGETVELRIYLNQKTYFKIEAKVAHVTYLTKEGIIRHGSEFIKDSANSEALDHFIKFLESVVASLKADHGDVMVSKINS